MDELCSLLASGLRSALCWPVPSTDDQTTSQPAATLPQTTTFLRPVCSSKLSTDVWSSFGSSLHLSTSFYIVTKSARLCCVIFTFVCDCYHHVAIAAHNTCALLGSTSLLSINALVLMSDILCWHLSVPSTTLVIHTTSWAVKMCHFIFDCISRVSLCIDFCIVGNMNTLQVFVIYLLNGLTTS